MNSTLAAWLQFLLLFARPRGVLRAARQLDRAHLHRQEALAGGARHLQADRDRPGRGHALDRLRALHPGVLARRRAVRVPDRADPALAVLGGRDGERPDGHGVEHRGVVRHEHQLAELRRRSHHELPDPAGRADGAAVLLGRGRPGGRDRDDPRLHPVPDRPAGQLLGGRDPRDDPAADPDGGHRLHDPGGRRGDREPGQLPHDHHAVRRPPDDPRRHGGVAGSHQGPGQQRRRLVQHQRGPPVREPEPVHEHLHRLPAAADPVRHAAGVRQDGRRQQAGLRAGRRHGDHLGGRRRRDQLLRDPPGHRRSRAPARARRVRGRGDAGSARRAARCSRRPPR